MVCYEILTGQVPFSNSTPREVRKMVLNGDRPKLPDQCPSVLKGLIHSCWQAEASSRPSFMEICKQLRYLKYKLIRTGGTSNVSQFSTHPWIVLESESPLKGIIQGCLKKSVSKNVTSFLHCSCNFKKLNVAS
jgi:serine/threonine protein kinase